jgi:hypothetical protein
VWRVESVEALPTVADAASNEKERFAYEKMFRQYPDGAFSCVPDSPDIRKAAENLRGGMLRDGVTAGWLE